MTDPFLVLTPEKVVVSYRVCGFGTRFWAHALDVVIAGSFVFAVLFVVSFFARVFGPELMFIGVLIGLVAFLAYFVLFEGLWRGQTVGKKAFGLRVVMVDGTPVTFLAALYRNLLRPADMVPALYLVGILAMFLNPRSQRLGDLVAGTVVIGDPTPSLGFTPAPHRVGIHRYESTVGELRRMSIEEYQALKRLCDRFPLLPAETQQWAVDSIWAPFAERHGIQTLTDVHPIYQMQAVVMKYGRLHKLI